MQGRLSVPVLVTLAAVLAGCGSAPKDGSDQASYYFSNRNAAPAVAPVIAAAPPTLADASPIAAQRVVYFDFDRSAVKPEYLQVIEAHAQFLKNRRGSRVALEGHADARGGREYNLALGQRRAESVRRSLLQFGVADSQIEAMSWGMEKPASTIPTEQGWQLNRRVEFSYR